MAINLAAGRIYLYGKDFPIANWEVWFQTPGGLHDEYQTAEAWARKNDCDPSAVIIPVPVAVTADRLIYEPFIRM